MRVLMLGWEFPPIISGGLGTACYGLTRALSRQGVHVLFVLPRPIDGPHASHLQLLGPPKPVEPLGLTREQVASWTSGAAGQVVLRSVPSRIVTPYVASEPRPADAARRALARSSVLGGGPGIDYQGDILAEAQRYAELCAGIARHERFDVIHAHDWMTFPAGLAVAAATGRPLVVHVHSTEYDRAGEHGRPQIRDIERRGLRSATRVVAVSHLTKRVIQYRYGVDPTRIDVVYNGIDPRIDPRNLADPDAPTSGGDRETIHRNDKIVLFLGRITAQKGPEFFVAAARKVLEKYDAVKFVMAGTGDLLADVIEQAAAAGIGHKVLFTGFLHGPDVERIFQMADVYVMPSVSEPFGIAPLEAIRHDVPVIVSKTSGVSEVLTHVLKVDFWNTRDLADKIIAVLRHPPLGQMLREHADMEVRRLTWDDAAAKCRKVYETVLTPASEEEEELAADERG